MTFIENIKTYWGLVDLAFFSLHNHVILYPCRNSVLVSTKGYSIKNVLWGGGKTLLEYLDPSLAHFYFSQTPGPQICKVY